MIGMDILNPRTVVVMSILLTSIRIRGLNLFVYQPYFSLHEPTQYTKLHTVKKILQNSGESVSVFLESPLVFSTRSIVIKHHLRQLLLRNILVLTNIGYLHFQRCFLILSLTKPAKKTSSSNREFGEEIDKKEQDMCKYAYIQTLLEQSVTQKKRVFIQKPCEEMKVNMSTKTDLSFRN